MIAASGASIPEGNNESLSHNYDQDYKHSVLGEPSDIYTDCGASTQDVRHLYACKGDIVVMNVGLAPTLCRYD